jgi:hypothetical protein
MIERPCDWQSPDTGLREIPEGWWDWREDKNWTYRKIAATAGCTIGAVLNVIILHERH